MTEIDILYSASRGNVSRYKEHGKWSYRMNGKRVSKKPIVELMRRGLLEAGPDHRPLLISSPIDVTIKGREAMQKREVSQR